MAKDSTFKNSLLGVLVLIVLLLLIFPGTFSTITDIGEIGQCRIVVDGNVCSVYTICEYEPIRDISCIKGYKIISLPDTEPSIDTSITEIGGGLNE